MGSFLARKRRIQGCPNWRCGHRGARSGGILCDWLGRHIWPSPIGPKLEGGHTGGKLSVTSSHGWQPSHLVRIATGVVSFLPDLVVVHCGSEFCFYIWLGHSYLYAYHHMEFKSQHISPSHSALSLFLSEQSSVTVSIVCEICLPLIPQALSSQKTQLSRAPARLPPLWGLQHRALFLFMSPSIIWDVCGGKSTFWVT